MHEFLMKKLMVTYADINATDQEENTPLHIAAEKNSREAVKHLLMNGADGNLKNNKQWAPVHTATLQNNPDIIEVIFSTFLI